MRFSTQQLAADVQIRVTWAGDHLLCKHESKVWTLKKVDKDLNEILHKTICGWCSNQGLLLCNDSSIQRSCYMENVSLRLDSNLVHPSSSPHAWVSCLSLGHLVLAQLPPCIMMWDSGAPSPTSDWVPVELWSHIGHQTGTPHHFSLLSSDSWI